MAAGSVADMAEAEVAAQLLGCEIRKLFPSHGYFTGTVSSFDADSRCFTVVYVDQDRELMPMSALAQHLPRQQALWIRAWLQRSAESTPGARTIANCAVDGVDEAQVACHSCLRVCMRYSTHDAPPKAHRCHADSHACTRATACHCRPGAPLSNSVLRARSC
jgi:hypothetical protein